jgi:hypothetical protein
LAVAIAYTVHASKPDRRTATVPIPHPRDLSDAVARRRAPHDQRVLEARKETLEPAQSAGEQPTPVAAPRHARAAFDGRGQLVAIETPRLYRNACSARAAQAADASADDDGVVTVETPGVTCMHGSSGAARGSYKGPWYETGTEHS